MQAFVLYPFCDRRAAVDDQCAHRIYYELRSLSLWRLAGSSNAAAGLGIHSYGTLSMAYVVES